MNTGINRLRVVLILSVLSGAVLCSSCASAVMEVMSARTSKIQVKIWGFDPPDAQGNKTINENFKVVDVTDPAKVKMILAGITSEDAELAKCGYHGSLNFFAGDGALLDEPAKFNIGCGYIII